MIYRTRNWVFYIPLLLLLWIVTPTATAVQITILNADGSGEGFNDPTAVSAIVDGNGLTLNGGLTLGEQRLNVFNAAADYWSKRLNGSVEVIVEAQFSPLDCGSNWAVLGSAGATLVHRDFQGSTRGSTWYPAALANQLAGVDLSSDYSEINATFNSSIDNNSSCFGNNNWWYGIGGDPEPFTVDLYSVVLHEIGHGLGFADMVQNNGAKFHGFDDSFMVNLYDTQYGNSWPNLTDAQRASSMISNGNLVWSGGYANEEASFLENGNHGISGLINMYAPSSFQSGSSVSHWDISLDPDEIMEPYLTYPNEDWVTIKALKDIGWSINTSPKTTLRSGAWRLLSFPNKLPVEKNTVESVLAEQLGNRGQDWQVFEYDPVNENYILPANTAVLKENTAYWIIQVLGYPVELSFPENSHRPDRQSIVGCTTEAGCRAVGLHTKNSGVSWNLLGSDFSSDLIWDNLIIKTNGNSPACQNGCETALSQTEGVFYDNAWYFDDIEEIYKDFRTVEKIDPLNGLWVATLENADGKEPSLLIPIE